MYDDILDILLDEELGQILCINIVLSIEHAVIERADARRFVIDWWDGTAALRDEGTALDFHLIKNQFRSLVRESEMSYRDGRREDGSLCKTSVPNGLIGGQFVNVKGYDSLYNYTLSVTRDSNASLLPNPENPDFKTTMADATAEGLWQKPHKMKTGGRLSPALSVCWVCPDPELSEELRSSSNRGDRARDYLGLIHHGQTDSTGNRQNILFDIELSDAELRNEFGSMCPVRPTFLDAGFHSRFKLAADEPERRAEPAHHGLALDLEKHCNAESIADGGTEFVYREDDCRSTSHVKISPLGFLSNTRPDETADKREFVERLLKTNDLTLESIRRSLSNLIR